MGSKPPISRRKPGPILAAVYNESGQLIDAEVARKGLGIPVSSGANTKYLATVRAAAAAVAALASAKVVHALLSAGAGSTKPVLWAAFSAADISRHLARVTRRSTG
ncbi:hypothetical protein [Arthrobacter sp. A5]|uniref:hypothetical protein n=1 Tax=Arthrobacter sp. A5 TaxID=576926 RepID=UPI003DA873F5